MEKPQVNISSHALGIGVRTKDGRVYLTKNGVFLNEPTSEEKKKALKQARLELKKTQSKKGKQDEDDDDEENEEGYFISLFLEELTEEQKLRDEELKK